MGGVGWSRVRTGDATAFSWVYRLSTVLWISCLTRKDSSGLLDYLSKVIFLLMNLITCVGVNMSGLTIKKPKINLA